MTTQNTSKNEVYPTETINGVKIANTTGQKGHRGRILAWKGPIPAEFKRAQAETPKSKE